MKLVYCLLTLSLFSFGVQAEAPKEMMQDRVEAILKEVRSMRKSLQDNNVKEACDKVPAIRELYKLHFMDSGVRLDLEYNRSHKVIRWAYKQLIDFHKLDVTCNMGKDQEYVHIEDTLDELKKVIKSLKNQGRKIKRSKAASHNSFRYDYNFQLNP